MEDLPGVPTRKPQRIEEGDEIWYRLPDENFVHHAEVITARQNTLEVERCGRGYSRRMRKSLSSEGTWLDRDQIKIIDHEKAD